MFVQVGWKDASAICVAGKPLNATLALEVQRHKWREIITITITIMMMIVGAAHFRLALLSGATLAALCACTANEEDAAADEHHHRHCKLEAR